MSDQATIHDDPGRIARTGIWLPAAVGALLYPLLLRSASGSIQIFAHSDSIVSQGGLIFAYIAAILAAYCVPALAVFSAFSIVGSAPPSPPAIRALRILHFVFAAPPLFTALGVYTSILAIGGLDIPIWTGTWGAVIVRAMGSPLPAANKPPSAFLRTFHGIVALAILSIFLVAHLANHILAIWTPTFHDRIMRILERVYRAAPVEPLLVVLFACLATSGLLMAWRHTAIFQDWFRTLQTLTGFYLAAFVFSHLSAVFIDARLVLHIPTDWAFATGGATGLIRDPWNVRLIPHYSIAVWAVMTHVGLGLRGVMRAHGFEPSANIVAWSMMGLGLATSGIIMAAMLGFHLGRV